MATTVAAVDIGTNSVKLTVARVDGGRLDVLLDTTRITRLGKGVDAAGRLDPEAMRRTLEALDELAGRAWAVGAARIAAAGTSALRDAANGPEFVEQAEGILAGAIEIVTGDREAHLIHTAIRRDADLKLPEGLPLAVMDIGGGSTEFVLGTGATITYRNSLQIGAVRLTERALPSDPPTPSELRHAEHLVDAVLAQVPVAADSGDGGIALVGSGGTIANVAAMEHGALEPAALHGMHLSRAQVEARVAALAPRTVAERKGIPGLEPERADVILAGALIQARAMHRLGARAVIVSVRNLRYGLLYELADAEEVR